MLLGDSIRLGYQDGVRSLLGADFAVWSPEENCRFAAYTLNSLRFYFEACPAPDVIHWNNGLWDACVLYPADGNFTPLEAYLRQMRSILRELRQRCGTVVFATTTPVRPDAAAYPASRRYPGEILAYNTAMRQMLAGTGVHINDLHGVVLPHLDAYLCEDDVHMTEQGYAACAHAVAAAIREVCSETL